MIEEIENARRRLGVTIDEAARRARIDPSTWSKAVHGVNSPRQKTIDRMVRALERIAEEQAERAKRLAAIGQSQQERNAA